MNRTSRIYVFSLLVSVIPGMILSMRRVADSFLYIQLARAQASETTTGLFSGDFPGFAFNPAHQGYELIITIAARVANIPIEEFGYLPIGGLVLPPIAFALAHHFTRSAPISALFTVFIAWDPALSYMGYSVFAYGWCHPLYFCFLISTLSFLRTENPRFAIVSFIIFCGAFSINWTVPGWMILTLGFALIFNSMCLRIGSENRRAGSGRAVFIATLVIFLALSGVVYT